MFIYTVIINNTGITLIMPGNKRKDKRRSMLRSRLRRNKYDYSLQYDDVDVTIHSRKYRYDNETRELVFTNPDLMNLILGYLGYRNFLVLGMVSKNFNELLKTNMDHFMTKQNTDYWKNYIANLYSNNDQKWKKNDELLESIFIVVKKSFSDGVIAAPNTHTWNKPLKNTTLPKNPPPEIESYKDLVYNTVWFQNHEFIEIYDKTCKKYPELPVYQQFVKTSNDFNKYLKGLRFCERCYNDWRWSRDYNEWCNCELQNNICREIYFS
tara:strand:+ start:276 stop:1076 length:801 start_codon:yes stop_codon:yes gene_type:complete